MGTFPPSNDPRIPYRVTLDVDKFIRPPRVDPLDLVGQLEHHDSTRLGQIARPYLDDALTGCIDLQGRVVLDVIGYFLRVAEWRL